MGRIRNRTKRRAAIVGVSALACVALAALSFALLRPVEVPASSVEPRPLVVTPRPTYSAPAQVKLADVVPRLADSSRPFTLAVLGDSTGSPRDGWVAMVGKWIGSTYDRPVTVRPWSEGTDPAGYLKDLPLTDGANAPVTILNASAPSQDGKYSLQKLDEMVPVDAASVDLIFINHGHNEGPGELEVNGINLMSGTAKKFTNAATVVIAQNPERTNTIHSSIQRDGVKAITSRAKLAGFDVIDVNGALSAVPNFDSMLQDNVHPTIDGYRLWADKVIGDMSAHTG